MNGSEIATYKIVSLTIFIAFFAVAAFYAYRPKNKQKFEVIAKLPMEDE